MTSNDDTAIHQLRTFSYRLYTMDGNFREAARGEFTLEFRSGADRKTPIVGVAMTMEGSSAVDPVLIPSGCESHALGHQMHVRLQGDGQAVNAFIGQVRPVHLPSDGPLYFFGEYRHVGKPFEQVLGTTWRNFYMLAQQSDGALTSKSPFDVEGNYRSDIEH